MSNAASRGARTQMVLEAKRARHGMHVVVSVSVAESTANERTIYETTELIDMHVHIQHNCTQHAASTRHGIDATCTPDIDLDGHTYHVTTPSAQHHPCLRPYGNRWPSGGAWHASERSDTPPDDRMLHGPEQGLHRFARRERPRPTLPLAAGRAARQADLLHIEEVFCAHGHARDLRDRSRVHLGEQQWCARRSTTRPARQDSMAQGQRRGLARTSKVFLEYDMNRKQKERTSEVVRSSEAEKLDVMIMTWAQREARSRVYPWRIERCNLRSKLACGMVDSSRRICRTDFARAGRQSVRAAWRQGSLQPSKAVLAWT